jgi:imidazolonepropionase-like amidohydrolase
MKIKFCLLAIAAIGSLFGLTVHGQTYAITNARIVTVSGESIEKGTVVIRNGLIESVGAAAKAPPDAQVFDGTGLTVYPGFIDALTNLGLPAAPARPPGGGPGQAAAQAPSTSNSNYPEALRPEQSVFDDLRAGEAQFEAVRNAGFTTVLTVSRSGIFNGQSAVIDLAGDTVAAMTIKTPFAEHVTFNTAGGGVYPTALMGTFSALRQMFLDAQRLQEYQKLYAANPKGIKRPDADKSLETLFPVINGQMPVVFTANREIEIIRTLDLIKEFNLKAIIAGGQEAWKVTGRIQAQNVPVLLSLNFPKRTASAAADADPESVETLRLRAETPKGPAKLAQAGIKFVFQSDGVRNIGDFFTNAGKAVESGLSKDAAIRAMTLGTAELLGVDNRLGSIETGKIANLAVIKGDVFGKDRYVTHVFVDGKLFEQKEPPKKETPATGTQPAALPNVGGNFSISIDIPGQPITSTLALTQQGAQLTGTMQSQAGTSPIKDGKVTADGFTFSSTVPFGGSSVEITVKGTVEGNKISGTIDSPQGAVSFSGTKNP